MDSQILSKKDEFVNIAISVVDFQARELKIT